MQNEVVKIGNASFLSQSDKTIIKRILNSDFEINDDFSGDRSKLTFDANATATAVEDGMEVSSNQSVISANPIKIYMAKYRKNSCDWEDIVYYGILEDYDSDVVLNTWVHLYTNERYCVYRIFAYSLPTGLPLSGALPSASIAPFIRYEKFTNVWLRRACRFKHENSVVSLVTAKGSGEWVLEASGDEECTFSYTKATPFGCDFDVPSTNTITITEDCECLELSSSSSSYSSSSSTVAKSSESSESSESSLSTESSSMNSSSSEYRMAPQNIGTLYLRLVGDPFPKSQFILHLESADDVPLVWSASTHTSDTLSTGTISLSMNASGRFILNANLTVDGSKIVIENALISTIRNDNFAYYSSYLKGLGTVCSGYITTKYTSEDGVETTSYDCIVSHDSMRRNTGAPKNFSEIIYDYELAELSVDNDADKVNLYFGRANDNNDDNTDICRAWGLFCLNFVSDGVWSYSNEDQEITLSRTNGGCWTLYRKYRNSVTETQEIEMEIDVQGVTQNISGEYEGFVGSIVVPRSLITGGVSEASLNDVCNDKDTVVAFYSSDTCLQDQTYTPYNGSLGLTVSGGGWSGKLSYILSPTIISSNLTVWNWSSGSKVGDFEYATLFSQDGILWKLLLCKVEGSSVNYMFAEFIKENKNLNIFEPVFQKVHKSLISLDGNWGIGESIITISGLGDLTVTEEEEVSAQIQDDTQEEESEEEGEEAPPEQYDGGGYEEGYEEQPPEENYEEEGYEEPPEVLP